MKPSNVSRHTVAYRISRETCVSVSLDELNSSHSSFSSQCSENLSISSIKCRHNGSRHIESPLRNNLNGYYFNHLGNV